MKINYNYDKIDLYPNINLKIFKLYSIAYNCNIFN